MVKWVLERPFGALLGGLRVVPSGPPFAVRPAAVAPRSPGWGERIGCCGEGRSGCTGRTVRGYLRAMTQPPAKTCVVCGRTMRWRSKWEHSWDEVRHCSAACRRRGVRQVDRDLETTIVGLLSGRARGTTVCPSEAARAVGGDEWRPLMEPARAAARRLTARSHTVITQGGRVVDPSTAKGPIRIRLS